MRELSEEGRRVVADVASRHAVSEETVRTLLMALVAGGGTQAQFSIPELGGMGQWSRGGMVMVGDMFNDGLKARVNALCLDLSDRLPATLFMQQSQSSQNVSFFAAGSGNASGNWWPDDLGQPSSTGSQNAMRYAVFPGSRRLAIAEGDRVAVYDTGNHLIGGVSQQQSGDRTLTFTSQLGTVNLRDLHRIDSASLEAPAADRTDAASGQRAPAEPEPARQTAPSAPTAFTSPAAEPAASITPAAGATAAGNDDPIAKIQRLAELRDRGSLRRGISGQETQASREIMTRHAKSAGIGPAGASGG